MWNDTYMWIGRVAGYEDPEKRGRVQVRIMGVHPDRSKLPDGNLPWIPCVMPNIFGGVSGQGTVPPPSLLTEAVVLGCSLDGLMAQQNLVLGLVPNASVIHELAKNNQGANGGGFGKSGKGGGAGGGSRGGSSSSGGVRQVSGGDVAALAPGTGVAGSIAQMTDEYGHLRYEYNGKSLNGSGIDCSGWVSAVAKNADGMDPAIRDAILSTAGSGNIFDAAAAASGSYVSGYENASSLPPGTYLFGADVGSTSHDYGQHGIDHVGYVTINADGTGVVSESRGSRKGDGGGVSSGTWEDQLRIYNNAGYQIYVTGIGSS